MLKRIVAASLMVAAFAPAALAQGPKGAAKKAAKAPPPPPPGAEEGEEPTVALEDEGGDVSVAGKIGYVPKTQTHVPQVGFVTGKELDEAGRIDSSFSETVMLSFPQSVYVTFKNRSGAKVGDKYVI